MKNKYFAKTAKGYGALLVILAALLILSGIIAISLGAVDIPMADTIHVLAGKLARKGKPLYGTGEVRRGDCMEHAGA